MSARAPDLHRPASRIDVVDVVADDELRVRWMPGVGSRLVLAFSGVQHGFGGIPMDEFVGSASGQAGAHVLFISDMLRSWYSRPGLADRIVRAVEGFVAQHGITDIRSIGNSMGGYGAILFLDRLPIRAACAFSPQVSMHPDVISEARWSEFRPFIGPELALSLTGAVERSKADVFVAFGAGSPEDLRQAALLPDLPRVRVHKLPGCGHDAVTHLKAAGLLSDVVSAAFAGDHATLDALYAQLGRQRPSGFTSFARKLGRRLRVNA